MRKREPITASEAIESGEHIFVTPLISNAVEEAKWQALGFQIEDVYKHLFPDIELPKPDFHQDFVIRTMDHIIGMLVAIQRHSPDIASMIFQAAEDHDLELDESVVSKRRSHLKVVLDQDDATQTPQGQSAPVLE